MGGGLEFSGGRGVAVTREQELEVTKSAFFLEDTLQTLFDESMELQRNKPQEPKPPKEPVIEQATIDSIPYPDIDVSSTRFRGGKWLLLIVGAFLIIPFIAINVGVLYGLIAIACFPISIVLAVRDYYKKTNLTVQRMSDISNSAEYIQACTVIDEQNRQQQAQLDKELHDIYLQNYDEYQKATQKYNNDIKYYNEVAMPEWFEETSILNTAMIDAGNSLDELYGRNIIPDPYRNHSALLWLSTYIGTSQFNLKDAVVQYELNITRLTTQEHLEVAKAHLHLSNQILQNQQYANWLHEQQIELTEQGNATLRSISNWQKADIGLREYRRFKANRAARR
jgi:hypothetical protein